MTQPSRFYVLFFFLLTFSPAINRLFAQAQIDVARDNSPLSRLGVGDIYNPYLAAAGAMGGTATTFHDGFQLSILNPASSAFLRATAYEVGIYGNRAKLKSSTGEATSNSGSISHFSLGFPLKNQINEVLDRRKKSDWDFGMHLALTPYSVVGYNIRGKLLLDGVGGVNYIYQGTGGLYKIQWGNSVKYKGFAAGLMVGHIFGKTAYDRAITFDSLSASYVTQYKDNTRYNGFIWNVGVMYDHAFMKKGDKGKMEPNGKHLTFGAYVTPATSFRTSNYQSVTKRNTSYDANKTDTISSPAEKLGIGKMPLEFSVGIAYEKEAKLKLAANYTVTSWSNYTNEQKSESLLNSYRFAVGGEYIPDAASYNSYGKKLRYRFGGFLGTDPRSVKNQQFKTQGVTLGLGLPIILPRQTLSFVNLGVEFGKLSNDFFSSNYTKLNLAFTLDDNSWFYKQRFK
jgi:hypothetical protein